MRISNILNYTNKNTNTCQNIRLIKYCKKLPKYFCHFVMTTPYSKFPIHNDPKIYFNIVQIIPSSN